MLKFSLRHLFLSTIFALWICGTSIHCQKTIQNSLLIKSKQCTQKSFNKLDKILTDIIPIGPNPRLLPVNTKELKVWCRELNSVLKEFERFIRNCFVKEARDLSLIVNYSIKQTARRYCTKPRSKATRELLASSPCLNTYIIPNSTACVDLTISKLYSVIELGDTQGKMPFICWYVLQSF